jgi:ribonuclease-3 family protein
MAQGINATTDIAAALTRVYTPEEARRLNPLTLAYIGDAVYSDYIRRYLIARGLQNVNHLTRLAARYVRASAQAAAVRALLPALTEPEQDLIRRGRNTKSLPPKHADKMDYRYATGLETLFGYLNLIGDTARERALMARAIRATEAGWEEEPSILRTKKAMP